MAIYTYRSNPSPWDRDKNPRRPGQEVLKFFRNVHSDTQCEGQWCVMHNPSPHHMWSWPITLRNTGLMERVCEHNVGHPDPDSLAWLDRNYERERGTDSGLWSHGCDGCCRVPEPDNVPF